MKQPTLLASELAPGDSLHALCVATCEQVRSRFPKTILHAGRTWWVCVSPGGPSGLAGIMLFDSPHAISPQHAFVAQLGDVFGHLPSGARPS